MAVARSGRDLAIALDCRRARDRARVLDADEVASDALVPHHAAEQAARPL